MSRFSTFLEAVSSSNSISTQFIQPLCCLHISVRYSGTLLSKSASIINTMEGGNIKYRLPVGVVHITATEAEKVQ